VFPEEYEKEALLIELEKAILFNRKLPDWFKEGYKKYEEGLKCQKKLEKE